MQKPSKHLALAILLASAPALPLPAWGALGHQMAATYAVQDLPPELAAWFAGRANVLHDHANDPDHWKQHDPLEGPRHYLDAEVYGGAAQVPLSEDDARAQVGAEVFQKNGQVPWAIQAQVDRLATRFATGDPGQVAFEAAILSHYCADISVPLHTTSLHDGRDPSQHGVHRRWESSLLERIVDEEGWAPEARPAQLGEEPGAAPWGWLREGFDLVPRVLADDLQAAEAAGRDGVEPLGPAYWKVFQRLEGPLVKEQVTLAANRTAQMILLAWTRAGMPAAPATKAAGGPPAGERGVSHPL